ncbi:MAG: radical SAM protein [Bacteroidetes bacterium]|nr:radical SAM protein [Bacteroidota bacterium]
METSIQWLPEIFDENSSLKFRSPFHTFLIKVASLCNLNCSYCYVYNSPDKSWEWKPTFLQDVTVNQISFRIREHVIKHDIDEITIIFHGGEPLLAGLDRLKTYVQIFSSVIPCKVLYGMQTNGTLLDKNFVDFFIQNNFRVGYSLDGPKEYNDKNRLYHSGKSSYDDTVRAIELVHSNSESLKTFGGLLFVIDINYEPAEILNTIKELGVKCANLILPDGHYESPPPYLSKNDLKYGKWLYDFFYLWYNKYPEIEIPYLEQIITMMIGGFSSAEEIGSLSVDFIVIDTNGDIEAVDTLKIVGREATSLNLNVEYNSLDDALKHPAIFSRMSGFNSLCKECQACEYLSNCGGGYIPHRYSKENGFQNTSVYCNDLKYLFLKMKEYLFVKQ